MPKSQLLVLALTSVLLSACAPSATATPLPSATATEAATATELPTDTPTSTPDYLATEAAEAIEAADALLAEIELELSDLNLSIDGAALAYVQERPIEIALSEQNFDGKVEPLDIETKFSDFIFGIDVTWETDTGFSGCGIVFRSERDIDRGAQVRFSTSRLSGAPLWWLDYYKFGLPQGTGPMAFDGNTAMRSAQGSTNHFLVVTQGLSVTIYANGSRIAASTLPAALTSGRFGVFTWEDSGSSTCTFENAWILEYPIEE